MSSNGECLSLAGSAAMDNLWLLRMRKSWEAGMKYKPNYYLNNPEILQSTAQIQDFKLGTGADIIQQLASAIEHTQRELVFVTCFWAQSTSLQSLKSSLKRLSARIVDDGESRVEVFIGLSSLSIMQKLFQTGSLEGHVYSAKEYVKKLGLPHPSQLPGLDITIKSIFVRPFSVMHPKFAIIDRKVVWLPSCNVSWEPWFEGVVVMSGPIVRQFVKFWQEFWLAGQSNQFLTINGVATDEHAQRGYHTGSLEFTTKALFLPSPHHAYALCIPFLMSTASKTPPSTPLTTFLLTAIQIARNHILIQTPNLTAFAVLHELLTACQNGVDIDITTSEKLMVLEQLVTAGTTTKKAVKWLVDKHRHLAHMAAQDPEAGGGLAHLSISYFKNRNMQPNEPVQSHIKLTIIDHETVVLGSQNLDRASWFTSQELGVAFQSQPFAHHVRSKLESEMSGKRVLVYDSRRT